MTKLPWPFRYAFAVFFTLLALLVRLLLRGLVNDDVPSETFLLVLIVVTLYAGLGPAILSLSLGGILIEYFFMEPFNSFAIRDTGDVIGIGLYFVIGSCIILVGDRARREHTQVASEKTRILKIAAQLSESEKRFRSFAENSSEMFIILRRDQSVEYVNQGFEALTGRSQADLYANPNLLFELTIPEDREFIRQHMDALFEEGVKKDIEFRYQRANADTGWLQVRADVICDHEGNPLKVIALAHDITERKHHQAEREQMLADLQASMEKVKQLSGLIPICAGCKNVRDDSGYWQQVESYIKNHSEAEFTHALCPDCLAKYGWTDSKTSPPASVPVEITR